MDLNIIDLNNINLDDDDFHEDDPETIIHVRLIAWCNRYKQHKACKKEIKKKRITACSRTSSKMVGPEHYQKMKIQKAKKRNHFLLIKSSLKQ